MRILVTGANGQLGTALKEAAEGGDRELARSGDREAARASGEKAESGERESAKAAGEKAESGERESAKEATGSGKRGGGIESPIGGAGETASAAGGGEWLFTDRAELDITDRDGVEAFFEREKPDFVINCAAYNNVDLAETEREAAFRINSDAPRFLAESAEARSAALIHISTDFVFRGNVDRPYTEEDIPSPVNVYGYTKMAGARAVMETGCRGAIIRTSWLYSPWGHNFVKSILSAAEKNSEIRVVADQTSSPTSATSLARAIVRMIPMIADRPDRGAEFYHFCDAGAANRADFAAEIIRQAGLSCRVVPVSSEEYASLMASKNPSRPLPPAIRPVYSVLSTAKITREFGIAPRPWQQELSLCLERIRN